MEPKSPSKVKLSVMEFTQYKRWLKLGVILLFVVLFFFGIYYALKPRNANLSKTSYFTVVVDCGSTGTRVNVYEWIRKDLSHQVLPLLVNSYPDSSVKTLLGKNSCQYHCLQTEPGLDKFVGNSLGIKASLEPLMTWAEQWVPLERHKDTPLFILATAGLRRLESKDAASILEDVEAVVKEHSFIYRRRWIRVLSGKEEAYYGWVALNYKMGGLKNTSQPPTLGLLDLGGSSLQVVMEVDDAIDDEHFIKSKIGFVEHNILAYSLTAFGINEAFDRTVLKLSELKSLSESAQGTYELKHPCLSSDFLQNYTCYSCAMQNTNAQKTFSQTLFTKYPMFNLMGDPNWEQCKGLARAAAINSSTFDWSRPVVGLNCKESLSPYSGSKMLNLTAVAHPLARFHALSGFFAIYNLLNLSPQANLTKLWEKGQQLCSKSWTDTSSSSSQNVQYCFRVPYMASLVEEALCLGNTEVIFGPGDVSWTLGAALVEADYLWHSTIPQIPITKSMEIVLSPIFLFVLLMFSLLVFYCSQVKLPMPGKKKSAAAVSLPPYVYTKSRPN